MTLLNMMGKTYQKPPKPSSPKYAELKSHVEHLDHVKEIKLLLMHIDNADFKITSMTDSLTGDSWNDAEIIECIWDRDDEVYMAAGDISAHLHYMTQDEVDAAGFEVSRAVWDRVAYTCEGILTGHWQMLEGSRTGL
jgi:hypothetical protein